VEKKSGLMHKVIDHAQLVHRTSSRIRVRIPARRNDHAYFRQLQQRLIGSLGVTAVEVNPLTASVLIEHNCEFKLATFRAVGVELAFDAHGGEDHSLHHRSPARTQCGDGEDLLWILAKLAYAAMTGRLWSHILEQVVGWCAQALIEAVLQPPHAPADVVRMALPPRPMQQHALAAAA